MILQDYKKIIQEKKIKLNKSAYLIKQALYEGLLKNDEVTKEDIEMLFLQDKLENTSSSNEIDGDK